MINIKEVFPEFLRDISIIVPTFSAKTVDQVFPAPTLQTYSRKCSLQSLPIYRSFVQVQPAISASGFYDLSSVLYFDYEDIPTSRFYLIFNNQTYVTTVDYRNLGSLNEIVQMVVFPPKFINLNWKFKSQGSVNSGSWVSGNDTTLSGQIAIWDIDLSPFEYQQYFVNAFEKKSDMMIALTHPASPVPPEGSIANWNGTDIKILHRSDERHPYSLGHILIVSRMVS